jgi:hypothetical protein
MNGRRGNEGLSIGDVVVRIILSVCFEGRVEG